MPIKRIENILLYVLYLTLGTYAVPDLRVGWNEFAVPYAVMLTFVLMIISIIRLLKERSSMYLSPKILIFVYGYLLSIVISVWVAQYPDITVALKYALFALVPILIAFSANRVRIIKFALICLAISGLAVFIFGLYGFFSGEIGSPYEHSLGYFGVTYEPSTRNSDMLYLQSTFWILLSIWLFGFRGKMRTPIIIVLLLLAAGMLLSLARGTWISTSMTLLITMLISMKFKSKRHRAIIAFPIMLGILLLGIIYLVNQEQDRLISNRFATLFTLSTEGGVSNMARIDLAREVIGIVALRPLGVGVANVRYYLTDFYSFAVNHAENVYLQVLVEQGVVGFLSFLILLVWSVTKLWACIANRRLANNDEWIGWALFSIVINWMIYGLFNNLVDNMWFWLVISLAVSFSNITKLEERSECKNRVARIIPSN